MRNPMKFRAALLAPVLLSLAPLAAARIDGIEGAPCPGADACFELNAGTGHITLGDGNVILAWGYADAASGLAMQYPGPTLKVTEGQTVQVTLNNPSGSNALGENTSIVFPGQEGVIATGTPGTVTAEAAPGSSATYTFTAGRPGTYLYESGSHTEVQLEMGLAGALIVYPADTTAGQTAYGSSSTAYDREYLYFLSDMDRSAHEMMEFNPASVDPTSYAATLWFINGRNGPDTLSEPSIPWMPHQPYNALTRAHPGERVLMRIIGGGIDMHPFHHHGNNAWVIARDARVLESAPGADAPYPDYQAPLGNRPSDGLPYEPIPSLLAMNARLPDQAESNYTVQTVPGKTYDAIFTWTGMGLNWDIYANLPGHSADDCGALGAGLPADQHEDPNSHCLDIPVTLPEQQALTFGGLWSGSPFLGTLDPLPPGQGGLNPNGGFSFMWHSHTERELTNDDVFPGGMMTMMIIESPSVVIE